MEKGKYKITKEQQLKELTERITPIINVDVVIAKDGKYLLGRRNTKEHVADPLHCWLFPGGRMRYTESPQETAKRILKNETPGLKANVRKLITALSDKGYDHRANGVTLYYLCDYISGHPKKNSQLDKFAWVTHDLASKLPGIYKLDLDIFEEIDHALRMMHSNEDEMLLEVDKRDKKKGSITKRDAHSTNKRYHRAAHIIIFNSKGQVVLQKRSQSVIRSPGFWDMAGGHQVEGQTIEQCAKSEVLEELGIETKLTFQRKGLKKTDNQAEFYYLFYGVSDGPYGFNKNEVEQIKAFDCEKLINGDYDKTFDILEHVKEYVKELRDVWGLLVR